jgi:hypothetical protein
MRKVLVAAIAVIPTLTFDQLNGLVALGALGVATFAIYALLQLGKDRRK